MSRARAIGIVLLAAGEAARYGAAKQLLLVGGEPMVRRVARAALEVSPWVTVVLGAHSEEVGQALHGLAAETAVHARWADGMGSSLAFGMQQLRRRHDALDAIVICLADQPAIGAAHLRALVAASEAEPVPIVASAYGDGVLGAPCLFPSRFFGELEALDGAEGARRVLRRHAGEVRSLPMPEARIDIDTPQDYRRWQAAHAG